MTPSGQVTSGPNGISITENTDRFSLIGSGGVGGGVVLSSNSPGLESEGDGA